MAGASSSDTSTISLQTLLHLLTIKLSSTNYLLWKTQILPILSYQGLLSHIDGSIFQPHETLCIDLKTSPNPEFLKWKSSDQQALLILQSSLTEEAMSEAIGLNTARSVWTALEAAYSHDSPERMHTLRDSLRQLQKGDTSVAEYGRKYTILGLKPYQKP